MEDLFQFIRDEETYLLDTNKKPQITEITNKLIILCYDNDILIEDFINNLYWITSFTTGTNFRTVYKKNILLAVLEIYKNCIKTES